MRITDLLQAPTTLSPAEEHTVLILYETTSAIDTVWKLRYEIVPQPLPGNQSMIPVSSTQYGSHYTD
jgi:hypothetical protein